MGGGLMLYMLGTVMVDTKPFSIDQMERVADASIVAKPVIGGLQPKEFTGEGEDEITLSGQILPYHVGGLDELELLHGMRRAGARFPLQRGDGWRPGWYAITRIAESHSELSRDGVGFVVRHQITMIKVDADADVGQQVIFGLLNLFDALLN